MKLLAHLSSLWADYKYFRKLRRLENSLIRADLRGDTGAMIDLSVRITTLKHRRMEYLERRIVRKLYLVK